MANELTAAALIALLREHPGACGMLNLKTTNTDGNAEDIRIKSDGGRVAIYGDDAKEFAVDFGYWLTGAAVEKHIELGMAFPERWANRTWCSGWDATRFPPSECKQHTSFLHAALAAIEAHAKEKS